MGKEAKPWMMVVQAEMVRELDLLGKRSGLARPDFARKIMSQGLMVERWLQQQGLDNLLGKEAQPSKESEPKASPSPAKPAKASSPRAAAPAAPARLDAVIRPVDGLVAGSLTTGRRPAASKTPRQLKAEREALEDVPPMLLPSILETAEAKPQNPFDALDDDYVDPDVAPITILADAAAQDELADFIDSLTEAS